MICPRDKQFLEERKVEQMSVFQCPHCHGIWLAKQDFTPMLHTATASSTLSICAPRLQHDSVECPVGNELHDLEHRIVRGVPIDYCKRHQGFWLDGGELEMLRQRAQLAAKSDPARKLRAHVDIADAGWWVAGGKLARGYQPSAHSGWLPVPASRRMREPIICKHRAMAGVGSKLSELLR